MNALNLAVAALVLLPLGAQAAGDAGIARQSGLIGLWAVDCGQPASLTNPFEQIFVTPAGTVDQSLDMGSVRERANLHGLHANGHFLSMNWDSPSTNTSLAITLRMDNNKMQSWSSARADGTVLVRNGKGAAKGNAMPQFERCVVK